MRTNFLTSTGFFISLDFLANGFLSCVFLTFAFFGDRGATAVAAFLTG